MMHGDPGLALGEAEKSDEGVSGSDGVGKLSIDGVEPRVQAELASQPQGSSEPHGFGQHLTFSDQPVEVVPSNEARVETPNAIEPAEAEYVEAAGKEAPTIQVADSVPSVVEVSQETRTENTETKVSEEIGVCVEATGATLCVEAAISHVEAPSCVGAPTSIGPALDAEAIESIMRADPILSELAASTVTESSAEPVAQEQPQSTPEVELQKEGPPQHKELESAQAQVPPSDIVQTEREPVVEPATHLTAADLQASNILTSLPQALPSVEPLASLPQEEFRGISDEASRDSFTSEDEQNLPGLAYDERHEPNVIVSVVSAQYSHSIDLGKMLFCPLMQVKQKIAQKIDIPPHLQQLHHYNHPLGEGSTLVDCLPFEVDMEDPSPVVLQLYWEAAQPAAPSFYGCHADSTTNDLSCDQAGMLDSPYFYSLWNNGRWTNPFEPADDHKYLSMSKPIMYYLAHEMKRKKDSGDLDSKKFLEQFHYTYKMDAGMLVGNTGVVDKVALHSLSGGEDAARRRKQQRRGDEHVEEAPQRWCETHLLKYQGHMESGQVEVLATLDGAHVFAPIQATGDGNCLMHAVSKAIFGVECWYKILRAMMIEELIAHPRYYCDFLDVGVKEYQNAVKDAETYDRLGTGQVQRGQLLEDTAKFLSLLHVAALASCINRPITLYGPPELMAAGIGYNNQCGTFLPRKFIQRSAEWEKWAAEHPPKDGQPAEKDLTEEQEYELAFEKGVPSCLRHLAGRYILQDILINGRRCWKVRNEYQFYLLWSPFWKHHKHDRTQAWQNQIHFDPDQARLLQHEPITYRDLPLQLQRKFLMAIRTVLPPADPFDESACVSRGMEVSEGKHRHLAAHAAYVERKTSEFIDHLRLAYGNVEDEDRVITAVRRSLTFLTNGTPDMGVEIDLSELVSSIVSVRAMRGEWVFTHLVFPEQYNLNPSQVDWTFDEWKKPGVTHVPHAQNPKQMAEVRVNVMQGAMDSLDDLEVCGYTRTAFHISNSRTPPLDVESEWHHHDKNINAWVTPRHHHDLVQRKIRQWKALNDLANAPAMECAWLTEYQRMCLLHDCDQYGKFLQDIYQEVEYSVELAAQRQKIEQQQKRIAETKATPAVRHISKWACRICTFHNSNNQDICGACDHPRDDADSDCSSFEEEAETAESDLVAQQRILQMAEKRYVQIQTEKMRAAEFLIQMALGIIYGDDAHEIQLIDAEHAAVRMARPQMPLLERHGNRPTPPPITIAWQKLGLHFIPLIEIRHAGKSSSNRRWDILPETLAPELRSGCCLQNTTTNLDLGSEVLTRPVFVAELLNDILNDKKCREQSASSQSAEEEKKSYDQPSEVFSTPESVDQVIQKMSFIEKRQLYERLQEEVGDQSDQARHFAKPDFILPETRMKLSPMSSRAATTLPLDQESISGGTTFSLAPPSPSHSFQSSFSGGSSSSSSSANKSPRALPNSPCSSNASSPRVSMTVSPRVSPNVSPRVSPILHAIPAPAFPPSNPFIGRKNSIDPTPVEDNGAGFVVGRSRSVSRRTSSRGDRHRSPSSFEGGRNSLSRNLEPHNSEEEDELFGSRGRGHHSDGF